MKKNKSLFIKGVFSTLFILTLFSTANYAQNSLNIYGYFSTRLEKQFETKSSGEKIADASPYEWTYPFFNIMMQHQINDNFKIFINLNGAKASNLDVRNFWGEYSQSNYLNIRLGKIYRKFGLYNEILDAVPTYYGIEPPELFDTDHLIVSRTTTLMVYGSVDLSAGDLSYCLTNDNGEGGVVEKAFPLGFDLNYRFGGGDFVIGTSGYLSGGDAVPDVKVGGGSPKSGVLPWMDTDHFNVLGGYTELRFSNLLLQFEYWTSKHTALRNPANVITLVRSAGLNENQLKRMVSDPSKNAAQLTAADVITNADFNINTWYVRAGYSIDTKVGEVAPYIQWDYYKNPETIESKTYGGDEEAGSADDGIFNKSTVGILYRPIPEVAVKFDQSFHFYKSGGKNVYYPEIRFDVSYIFGN
jgi:hypothetical protein